MSEYETNVDVDGDGQWDDVNYEQNADGSVTITADQNNDGVVDFVAQDYNADGIDYSDATLHIGTYVATEEQLSLLEGGPVTVEVVG